MPISSDCPMCGHKWQAPDGAKGKQVRCPECYQVYGIPGAPERTGASQTGASQTGASRTGASHAGAPKRAATNGSYAGGPVVKPSASSHGGARRPATAGSQAGNQAIRRPADTPAPFSAPTPAPAPRRAAEPEPRSSGGGGSYIVGILLVLFLLVGLGGAGLVGLIYLKRAVDSPDSAALAKADDTPKAKADEPQPTKQTPTEAEKKSTTPDKKPTTPEKKPTTDKKVTAPDKQTTSPDPKPVEPVKPVVQKPPASRAGYLVNMLQEPAVLGDGELKVTSAAIGSVQAKDVDPKNRYFVVRVVLRNTSKTNKFDFFGWGVPDSLNEKTPPQLVDSMGNAVKQVFFPPGTTIDGQTTAQTLHPGEQATDVLVFAVPRSDTLFLKLVLGGPDKREGTFRVLIPASKFVAPEPKPPPPIVKVPDPKPPVKPPPPVVVIPPEVAALLKGLNDPKPEVQLAAIIKLGELKADAATAVPELVKHLNDASEPARLATAVALGLIGPKAAAAAPDLVGRLKADASAAVRVESARALGLIGPAAAAGATDALKVALQDTDATVVTEVRAALKLINPE